MYESGTNKVLTSSYWYLNVGRNKSKRKKPVTIGKFRGNEKWIILQVIQYKTKLWIKPWSCSIITTMFQVSSLWCCRGAGVVLVSSRGGRWPRGAHRGPGSSCNGRSPQAQHQGNWWDNRYVFPFWWFTEWVNGLPVTINCVVPRAMRKMFSYAAWK